MTLAPGGILAAFQRCRRNPGDSLAWEQLLRLFYPSLNGISSRLIRQFGLSGTEDRLDLMQEICLKLSRSLTSVPGSALETEETILAYLRALAANAARDVLRARFARKRGETETVPIEDRLPGLATELDLRSTERATLLRQIDEMLDGSAREKSVFWLYFRQGFTAREISLIPTVQLSIKGVESLLHRMTEAVRSRMEQTSGPHPAPGVQD